MAAPLDERGRQSSASIETPESILTANKMGIKSMLREVGINECADTAEPIRLFIYAYKLR